MNRFAKSSVFCAACFFLAPLAHPQSKSIAELVAPLVKKASHSRKAVVLPLLSGNTDSKLGILLAKQISASLAAEVNGLQMIDASSANLPTKPSGDPPHPMYDHVALNSYARSLGADLVITGDFAPFEGGLGVSVDLFRQGHQEVLATSSGKLEFTEEMKQLPSPGASPDGVYLAGWAGVGMPRCLRCPDPHFPRGESGHGFVVLSAVIGSDGLLRLDGMQVRVTTKASYTDAAIAAVKGWRFEPAKGPTGKPVAVRVPVEVTFR